MVRQEGGPLSTWEYPKTSGNCSLASAAKIFPLWLREPCTTRQGSVRLWHGAASGGVEALGLDWLHAGMEWEASSGSEGAGEPPSGLHGDVRAQRMMGES